MLYRDKNNMYVLDDFKAKSYCNFGRELHLSYPSMSGFRVETTVFVRVQQVNNAWLPSAGATVCFVHATR